MDEKLTALRRQMGEVAWSDRVARAKERETLVLLLSHLRNELDLN